MGRLYYGVEDYENAIRAFDYAINRWRISWCYGKS
jgi:hypothetical protein